MKKRLSLQDKAVIALKKAVREVVERHKKAGRPLAVWKNGKVVKMPASRIPHKSNEKGLFLRRSRKNKPFARVAQVSRCKISFLLPDSLIL